MPSWAAIASKNTPASPAAKAPSKALSRWKKAGGIARQMGGLHKRSQMSAHDKAAALAKRAAKADEVVFQVTLERDGSGSLVGIASSPATRVAPSVTASPL